MKRIGRFPKRRGAAVWDYVLTAAVIIPISAALFFILMRALKALYYFSSIALGWIAY